MNWKDWVLRRAVQGSFRQATIDSRARAIASPIERLRFLRNQMGPEWAGESGSRWPVFTAGEMRVPRMWRLAVLFAFGSVILVPVYKFSYSAPVAFRTAMILAPPAALSAEAPNETGVWLVDRKNDVETYSNGLRIENRYAVDNRPRGRYKVYSRDEPSLGRTEWMEDPAGIVFHTTESDQIPMEAAHNRTLQRIGLDVLTMVQQNRSYHFMIDRFGRVFRVVKESDIAFHAGNSVWADEKRVYAGLNTSFLAIAFETQTRPDQDVPSANTAQIHSGRVLTALLRSKYRIPAINCVTHAQVSVNPSKCLVGYHTDWAANFPFLELGLNDNYTEPPASIAIFGFDYDPLYVQSTGARLLPGLLTAENQLRAQAARLGWTLARYKAAQRRKYLEITAYHRPEAGAIDTGER